MSSVSRPGSTIASWGSRVGQALRRPSSAQVRTVATPMPAAARAAIWATVAVSVLAMWLLLYAFVFSALQQHRTNTVLYATLRQQLSEATAPVGGVIEPGTPVALLEAPVAGLSDSVVVEGTAPGDLRGGPGHLRSSPLPGQAGVAVLFGRSATFGAPFKHITGLRPGNVITVTTAQGRFEYRVDRVRRPGDPVPSQLEPGAGRLLLETSSGSSWSPTGTVYVDATLRGTAQPTPPGRPRAVPAFERAMHADTSVTLPLVLWLQALVLVAVGIVWARARWGAWQAWIVGVPLLVAILWGSSSTALMLIPNLV